MQYGQLPKQILSRHGFEGCLASLDLSGESTDLITDAVVPSSLVTSGCDIYTNVHPGKKCTHDLCANHGTCVQQWNSYTCDCDMTSFTGPTCNDGKGTGKKGEYIGSRIGKELVSREKKREKEKRIINVHAVLFFHIHTELLINTIINIF